jgi:4-amino-4-deoxy-L-arabinose transferase-like glycosyltransferase
MLSGAYITTIVVLSALPLLFLVARLLAKRSRLMPWTIDDILLVLALLFLFVVMAMFIFCKFDTLQRPSSQLTQRSSDCWAPPFDSNT